MSLHPFQVATLLLAVVFVAGCGESPAPADLRVENLSDEAAPVDRPPEADEPRDRPSRLILDKTFDDIKFEMEKGASFEREMIGPTIEGLKNQRIRIRGYMLPGFQQKGITQFVLVRDNMECCFGPGAALFDCILVDMEPKKSVGFSIRPIAVVGVFDVQVVSGPDGYPLAIYHLQASEVK